MNGYDKDGISAINFGLPLLSEAYKPLLKSLSADWLKTLG